MHNQFQPANKNQPENQSHLKDRKQTITLIAAMATNGVIGRDNTMPWHLPNDLRHFKHKTMGKPIIMGSNTLKSIGRPLPGRTNIILSKSLTLAAIESMLTNSITQSKPYDWQILIAQSLPQAIAMAQEIDKDIFVIGGGHVYEQSFQYATHLALTIIHSDIEGDTYFPAWDSTQWKAIKEEHHEPDDAHQLSYSFVDYEII